MNRNCKKELKCPFTDSTVENAFGQEVNLFMHCHMRGYDRHGEGKQLDSGYYDKYGAPVNKMDSWLEGYHAVEKLLAKHFNICDNQVMDFPLVAGMAGGVHLYKPLHNDQPWNWTGWIPKQQKWLCEGVFFSNRYFLSIRGNEIQNNLWDYHPHDEEDGTDTDDMEYSQLEPNDAYRGGYFFEDNPFGRYLHVMSLRSHVNKPETELPERFNYIVHPLAYRGSLNNIPDNGVDAMQWCIIQIAKEKNFYHGSPWGDKCHALEIFNDFTYSASYAPEPGHEDTSYYNGTLIPSVNYIYWFNTYPLEYAEFLLDSALARGVYLQTLTCNDAFYQKLTSYNKDITEEERTALIHGTNSDPKGGILVNQVMANPEALQERPVSKAEELAAKRFATNPKTKDLYKRVFDFLSTRPYGFETVFGYTHLIDTKRELKKVIFDREVPGAGLDEAGCLAMQYLREGSFFSSTGVYNMFNYEVGDAQLIPYVIKGQPIPNKICSAIEEGMSLEFTFQKCYEKNSNLVWRYTIMSDTESKTLETVHGYFKLSTKQSTVLNLSGSYDLDKVKWLYFIAINPDNPMRRAWFNAVRGPAFGEPRVNDFVLPNLQHKVFSTKWVVDRYVQGEQVVPLEVPSADLDFMFPACPKEKEDICVYFLQVCPLQQNTSLPGLTDKSSTTRPPRILQSVHGLFLMHPEHATRLKLTNSWDDHTVKDNKVYFYEVNATTGKPQEVRPVPEPRKDF